MQGLKAFCFVLSQKTFGRKGRQIFLACKCGSHLTNTFAQRKTSPIK
jgi:hypothetical protein